MTRIEMKIIKGIAKLFCFELTFFSVSILDVFLLISFLFLIIFVVKNFFIEK